MSSAVEYPYIAGQIDALTVWIARLLVELSKQNPAMFQRFLTMSLEISLAAPTTPREQGGKAVHVALHELLSRNA